MSAPNFEPADVAALRAMGVVLVELNRNLVNRSGDATDLERLATLQRSADEAITAAGSLWRERGRAIGRHPGTLFAGSHSHVRLVSIRTAARSYAARYRDALDDEGLRREVIADGSQLEREIERAVNGQRSEHTAARNHRINEAINLDLERRARGTTGGDAA